ncbi:unnamed protein product [Prunus armeniaca]
MKEAYSSSQGRILWTLYEGSETWLSTAMTKKMRRHLSRFASATSWQITEFTWRILASVNFLGCWKQ